MDRYYGNEWGRKGATISDKTARLEYGLTQDEIYDAIDACKLQYRPAAMHGNAPRTAWHPAQPAAHSTTPQTAAAPGLHTIAKVDFVHVGTAKHALPPRHRCCLHP